MAHAAYGTGIGFSQPRRPRRARPITPPAAPGATVDAAREPSRARLIGLGSTAAALTLLLIVGVIVREFGDRPVSGQSPLVALAESVKDQVRGMMKNPRAAVFRDVRVVPGQGGKPIVCGYVSATKSPAAHLGESRFVTSNEAVYVLGLDKPNVEGLAVWNSYCPAR